MHSADGPVVVTVGGRAPDDVMQTVAEGLAELADQAPVVVEVDGLVLHDAGGVRVFLGRLLDVAPGRVVLCCSRLTGRRLLRRWAGDDIAVFGALADALAHAGSRGDGPSAAAAEASLGG